MDEEFIETNEDGEEISASDLVKKLREKLKIAEEKSQEYLTGWQKERADLVNARKRDEQAQSEFTKFANEKLIRDFLPILDSFDVALGHAEGEVKKGIEQIRNQIIGILEKNGVKQLSLLGEEFNPAYAEAITMIQVENEEDDHKVVEVLQTGYTLHDKVIRPAMVKVGEYKN